MNYKKHVLIGCMLSFFLLHTNVFAQSKSKEILGKSIVNSIQSENVDSFKALLLPKEVVLKLLEDNVSENSDKEEGASLNSQSEATYKNIYIPKYEDNFWEMVNLSKTNDIDWSSLDFMALYKYASNEHENDVFLIHTKLKNSDYKHFYFSAVRYQGAWYIEDKMELTKQEKYAPND